MISRRKRKNYVEKAIKPGLALLADRKYDELDALLAGTANQLFAWPRRIWTSWSPFR